VRAILEAFKFALSTRPNASWEGPLAKFGESWEDANLGGCLIKILHILFQLHPPKFACIHTTCFAQSWAPRAASRAALHRLALSPSRPSSSPVRAPARRSPSPPTSATVVGCAERSSSPSSCPSCVASAAPVAPDPPACTMQPALERRVNMLDCSTSFTAAQPPLEEPLAAVVQLIFMLFAARVARSQTRPLHLLSNDSRLTSYRSLFARRSST
jgi:hypothetical protein